MGNLLRVSVLAPDDLLAALSAGALIRLERAATEDGVYAEVLTEAIEAEVFSYVLLDSTGSVTDWYRVRYSNAGNTIQTGYEDAFSLSAPQAYASLNDLLLRTGQGVDDTRFHANATERLKEAAADLDNEIGYSALEYTGSRLYDGTAKSVLHVHGGILSLTSVEIRLDINSDWTTLQAEGTGWYLEGDLDDPESDNGVYYHVRLFSDADYGLFPTFKNSVRLTGVFGGHAARRKAANIAWARQRLAMEPSAAGGPIGPDELGNQVSFDRWPREVKDFIDQERHRFFCHV